MASRRLIATSLTALIAVLVLAGALPDSAPAQTVAPNFPPYAPGETNSYKTPAPSTNPAVLACQSDPHCVLSSAPIADRLRCHKDPGCREVQDDRPKVMRSYQGLYGISPIAFSADWAAWLTDPYMSQHLFSRGTAANLDMSIRAASLALVGIFMTFAVIHFWATGFVSATGGLEVFTAPVRAAGATLFIVAWPGLRMDLSNLLRWLSLSLRGRSPDDIAGALGTLGGSFHAAEAFKPMFPGPDIPFLPGPSDLMAFLLGITVSLVALALSAVKIMMTIGLFMLFMTTPLLAAAWVLPGATWILHGPLRGAIGLGAVPVAWAAELRAYSALPDDEMVSWAGQGTFFPSLGAPMLGIVLLLLLFVTQRQIFRWANLVSGGSRPLGAAWGTVMGLTFMGARLLGSAGRVGGRLPRTGGRQRTPGGSRQPNTQQPRPTPAGGGGGGGGQNTGGGGGGQNTGGGGGQNTGGGGGGGGGGQNTGGGGGGGQNGGGGPNGGGGGGGPNGGGGGGPNGGGGDPNSTSTDWSMPEGGDRTLGGEGVNHRSRVETEFQASRNRLAEHGPPSTDDLLAAHGSLSEHQQAQLRGFVGPPDGGHLRPELAMAKWVSGDGLTTQERNAARTLLDGAHHNQTRQIFNWVASQP
jgi:hypothetical protein